MSRTVRTGVKVNDKSLVMCNVQWKSLSESFKVVAFMLYAALQSMGPAVEYGLCILMFCNFSQQAICLKFKGVEVWEADAPEVLLQPVEQPKVTGGEVRAVRRMVKHADVTTSQPALDIVISMCRCIVLVQNIQP